MPEQILIILPPLPPMRGLFLHHDETWWKAVHSVAEMFRAQSDGQDLPEPLIKRNLKNLSFSESDIQAAFDFIEKANLSGNLVESLAMLGPPMTALRIHSPLETAYLPQKLRNRIEICRLKGFLSRDVVERLLESLRLLDSRGMDEDELTHLLADLLSVVVPSTPKKEFLKILKADLQQLFS